MGSLQISQPFSFREITEAFVHPLSPPGHQPLDRALLSQQIATFGPSSPAAHWPLSCTSPIAPDCSWSSSWPSAHPGTSWATTKPCPSLPPSPSPMALVRTGSQPVLLPRALAPAPPALRASDEPHRLTCFPSSDPSGFLQPLRANHSLSAPRIRCFHFFPRKRCRAEPSPPAGEGSSPLRVPTAEAQPCPSLILV